MIRTILFLLVLVCLTHQTPVKVNFDYEMEFNTFVKKFNRIYKTDAERTMRFKAFKENMDQVLAYQQKHPSAKFGVSKFADWTKEEKARISGSGKKQVLPKINATKIVKPKEGFNLPSSFDWRTRNMVTPVKDQGQCGSCWTFQSIAMVESYVLLGGSPQVILSEQELIDCDTLYGSDGCDGGNTDAGLEYISNKGVETEDDYPYYGKNDWFCHADYSLSDRVYIKSYQWYGNDNQGAASALMQYGPMAFNIWAPDSLYNYQDGVYDPSADECSTAQSNGAGHAVTIVGFGSQDGQDYWIIKNSWGTDWGMSGYFNMVRGDDDDSMACVEGRGDNEGYYAAITA